MTTFAWIAIGAGAAVCLHLVCSSVDAIRIARMRRELDAEGDAQIREDDEVAYFDALYLDVPAYEGARP